MANNSTATAVTFWGAARTVTGSMHLLEFGRHKILLDCGFFQGRRSEARERNSRFPFDPASLSAVVLSHAHIDHCGNLPNLMKQGFNGPIYCTPATRDLLAVMLADSAKIQEEDAEFLNKKRKPSEPRIEPLYHRVDVLRTLKLVQSFSYWREHDVHADWQLQFVEAGHLLGSAMVHLKLPGKKLTFTGDIGRKGLPILRDPSPIPAADVVICESTYGNRTHPPVELLAENLAALIRRTFERGGKLLIPAFSLGRTQTIAYFLHKLIQEGRLEEIPIFVDSPLAAAATEVYRLHPECFDDETALLVQENPDVFGANLIRYVRTVEESKNLNRRQEPCVVIAASGMCESGRILHHLKYNVHDPRNTVLIIGFQALETLGRRIVEKRPELRIHDQFVPLNAEVVVMNGFSCHADRNDLLEMLTPLAAQAPKLRFVHGEKDQAEPLMQTLREKGFSDLGFPERGATLAW
ncbi:MAG: MBL fold metallo-hydrolase [Gemmataceae bacterium]|nr:MBL fold metallo-hydrolase [Gemmataceae bacterium]